MPLCVHVFVRDPVTAEVERLQLAPRPPRDELAGLEASRQDLWGSEVVRALGCQLLPQLAEGRDLLVEGTALEALERELQLLLRELRRVCAATEYRSDFLEHRLRNVLEALRLCREEAPAGAGVLIGS